MRAWSLPVTWQRCRSHHSIRHSPKIHYNAQTSWFYLLHRIGSYMGDRNFYIARIVTFEYFAPVILTLTRWPSYTNLTRIPLAYVQIWTSYVKDFESYRLTDIHVHRAYLQTDTTENIYHAPSRVVRICIAPRREHTSKALRYGCERISIENRRFCSNGVRLAQNFRYMGSPPPIILRVGKLGIEIE